MRSTIFFLACLSLAGLSACGGGGGHASSPGPVPPPAPSLSMVYTDPPPGQWRWVRNAALSRPQRLVLDLEAPVEDRPSARGVAFALRAEPSAAAWEAPGPGGLVENLQFDLGPGIPMMESRQASGVLEAAIFQKGRGRATVLDGPICRVVLAARPGLSPGQDLGLSLVRLRTLPAVGGQLLVQDCALGQLVVR